MPKQFFPSCIYKENNCICSPRFRAEGPTLHSGPICFSKQAVWIASLVEDLPFQDFSAEEVEVPILHVEVFERMSLRRQESEGIHMSSQLHYDDQRSLLNEMARDWAPDQYLHESAHRDLVVVV